ncbi:hypothetical protein GCM10011363_45430 [Marivita lacus]|uniref:Uncharacterized protein n=1 Tax=Marivita lacus TaxID=1323742 RepID=A0ABQ1LGF4_9RHOB|nr:hypothetical protein GCM10011363_45430 [Marivita lacus]
MRPGIQAHIVAYHDLAGAAGLKEHAVPHHASRAQPDAPEWHGQPDPSGKHSPRSDLFEEKWTGEADETSAQTPDEWDH